MSKTIAYIRVSTDKQTVQNQRHSLLEYSHANKINIDEIVEVITTSKKHRKHRQIDETLEKLDASDTLLCYSLDRIGRSTIETLQIIEDIKEKGITLIIIKEALIIDPFNISPLNQMLLTMLTAVADLERSYISERTKMALQRIKANGTKLGRKKGQIVKSKYDDYRDKIEELYLLGLSVQKIVNYIGIGTQASLSSYIKSRGMKRNS